MFTRTRATFALLAVVGGLAPCAGCTSVQLRHSTVAQSTTLGDIYTKQVMDNLALFISNPDALPSFAYPNQGTTAIQDMGSLAGPGSVSNNFATSPFAFGVSRQATENWVLVPVSDPAKLALMRCAYRQSLSSCIPTVPASISVCPSCTELRSDFYGPPNLAAGDGGKENVPCLDSPCWLCWGCKHMIPKGCEAPYVGFYRGLYVWVPPCGRDMLTRLTLTILDYAVNDPRQFQKRTKSVQINVNEDGSINMDGKGIQITATLPIDVPSDWIGLLDRSPAYRDFLSKFPAGTAQKVLALASTKDGYDDQSPEQKKAFWLRGVDPDSPEWGNLGPAVKFIKTNQILPWLIPTEDVLQGPALFNRTGSASDGLQQLGQRLNAALAPSSPTGR